MDRSSAHVLRDDGLSISGERMSSTIQHDAESLRPATRSLLNEILSRDTTKDMWQTINGYDLMDLRASEGKPFALPLLVDAASFEEWDRRLSDHGGYEYDAKNKRIILKELTGRVHHGVVNIFISWFNEILEDQGVKRRVYRNLSLDLLSDSHYGSVRTPDACVVIGNDKGTILLEVSVAQHFDRLKERATVWLEGIPNVRLVILIHIEMQEYDMEDSPQSHQASQDILPYGLKREDFVGQDLATITVSLTTKIRKWHEAQDPHIPLLKAERATIYLCRRSRATNDTSFDEILLFDKDCGFIDQEACIAPEDFSLKNGQSCYNVSERLKLPLGDMKEQFGDFMEEEVEQRARVQAVKLVKGLDMVPR